MNNKPNVIHSLTRYNNLPFIKYLIFAGIFCLVLFFLYFSSKGSVQTPIRMPTPTTSKSVSKLYGVNMSGGEFGQANLPGKMYTDYTYPLSTTEYSYFAGKHVALIRLPILWERIQNSAFGPLSTSDSQQII